MIKLSFIILTHNEEININNCIKSINDLAYKIYVIDSFSIDETVSIAKKYTKVTVIQNEFQSYSKQLNFAINKDLDGDIFFRIDADEIISTNSKSLLLNNIKNINENYNGASVLRSIYFLNSKIRFGGVGKRSVNRIWKKKCGIFEDVSMDEHLIIKGKSLESDIEILDINKKGLKYWIRKHINYAELESIEYYQSKKKIIKSSIMKNKRFNTYYKLPIFFRPLIYFFYRYFYKFGILDGVRGLIFHFLQAFWYRLLVDIKIHEKKKIILYR